MVKKTSLLNKLVGRWRTSAVEVSEAMPRTEKGSGINRMAAARMAPAPEPAIAEVSPVIDRSSGRKLSVKEEALITMEGGLKELANLMRGVQVRLDSEGAQVSEMANDIKLLPSLGQAQLDVLRALVAQIDQQGRIGERLLQTMGDLPATLQGLRTSLDKVVAADERTAGTLAEFRQAMDTIHHSMREMVGNSKVQADNTEKLLRSQDDRAERMAESLASMVRSEKEKTERLAHSLEQTVGNQREQTDKLARSMESAISMAVQGATRDGTELRQAVAGLQRSHGESVQGLRAAHEDQATRLARMVEDGQRSGRSVLLVLVLVLCAVLAVAGVLLMK